MKLTIDRKRWLRGESSADSRLLRTSDMKMCCLGFLCLATGLTEDDIRQVATPGYLDAELPEQIKWLVEESQHGGTKSSKEAGYLMTTNDTDVLDEPAREQLLTTAFARHDIAVEFIG
jgi:hypothetical protein